MSEQAAGYPRHRARGAGTRMLRDRVVRSPRRTVLVAGLGAAGAGAVAGGVVAAVIAGVYAVVAVLGWRSAILRRRADQAYQATLEVIDAAVADLRAGLVPSGSPALRADIDPIDQDVLVRAANARLDAACRMSEALGAPLADLLDRVDADLRSGYRLRADVAAQTAGVRSTAFLLAGLPLAGVGLGLSMGADPVRTLLHTRIGAVCAIAAVLLQCLGLAWTTRLVGAAIKAVTGSGSVR